MPTNPKSYSAPVPLSSIVALNDITKSSIVGSLILACTSDAGFSRQGRVAIQRAGGAVDVIQAAAAVASGASSAGIVSKLNLNVGDKLFVQATAATVANRILFGNAYGCWPSRPDAIITNGTGTIVGNCGTNGIWASTDNMRTAQRVSTIVISCGGASYFAGAFRFYYVGGVASSADGLTNWTLTATTGNNPATSAQYQSFRMLNSTGGLQKVGADLYGMFYDTGTVCRLVKTTDGIAWTDVGVVTPQNWGGSGLTAFVWDGTRWLVGGFNSSSNAVYIYRGTGGLTPTAWTAGAAPFNGTAASGNHVKMASNGVGVVAAISGGNQVAYSEDGFATVTTLFSSAAQNSGNPGVTDVVWSGQAFLTGASGGFEAVSTSGKAGTWNFANVAGGFASITSAIELQQLSGASFVVLTDRIASWNNESSSLALPFTGGLKATASLLEIS